MARLYGGATLRAMQNWLSEEFMVIKHDPKYPYHSITFLDGMAVKQTLPIQYGDDGEEYMCL